MNVLYFVNRFPKLSESFVINEIHELERLGHRIAVFSLRRPEIDLQHEEVRHLNATVGYLPDASIGSTLRMVRPMVSRSDDPRSDGPHRTTYRTRRCRQLIDSDRGITCSERDRRVPCRTE